MSFAANLAEKLVTEHDLSEEELLYLLEHRQEVASLSGGFWQRNLYPWIAGNFQHLQK